MTPITFSQPFSQLNDEQIYELDNLVDDEPKDPTTTTTSSFEPYSSSDISNSSLNDLAEQNNSLKELLERNGSNNTNNNNSSILPSVSPLSSQSNINSSISIPPVISSSIASYSNPGLCRRDYVHINIQHNKSPFAVIPVLIYNYYIIYRLIVQMIVYLIFEIIFPKKLQFH